MAAGRLISETSLISQWGEEDERRRQNGSSGSTQFDVDQVASRPENCHEPQTYKNQNTWRPIQWTAPFFILSLPFNSLRNVSNPSLRPSIPSKFVFFSSFFTKEEEIRSSPRIILLKRPFGSPFQFGKHKTK